MARNYHVNRRKSWKCPYFRWDGERYVRCEAGKPTFPTRQAANEYMTQHCADVCGWEKCSLAQSWNQYLEEKDDNEKEAEGRAESGK